MHGWRVDGLLDRQVVSLQLRRRDESAIATLVGYGCHTVSVGMDFPGYSSDFPGALRRRLRQWTGGECVFFQGAAGNVLPRLSFVEDEREAERMGERLAIESIRSLSDGGGLAAAARAALRRIAHPDAALPLRGAARAGRDPACARRSGSRSRCCRCRATDELQAAVDEYEGQAREAEGRGAGAAELYGIRYHLKWARAMLADASAGALADSVPGSIHAVRIGAGVIVTAPGEAFTEIGMAVKQRAPGRPTLYAGYTNGAVGYFPTAAAYAEGGYEPAYSNRSYGRPAPVAPECERMLVERGVRLAERLFPEREPFAGDDWSASDALPAFAHEPPRRPASGSYAPPRTARHPQSTHGGQQ